MTRSAKLDMILNSLLNIDKKNLNEEPVSKQITMKFLCETLDLECEDWEIKSLEKELLEEKFVIDMDGELSITNKGRKLITRQKGYGYLDKTQKEEEVIREKTIEKFKYDKYSFWISVLAIIIAGWSLAVTLLMH